MVHGHFYQPPRENPWTGVVDPEPTAAPFHDWNQRIDTECYGPVGNARVLDSSGNVEHRDNLYASMSFDVGPTLFAWMETSAPATYARILEADSAQTDLRYAQERTFLFKIEVHHIGIGLADSSV